MRKIVSYKLNRNINCILRFISLLRPLIIKSLIKNLVQKSCSDFFLFFSRSNLKQQNSKEVNGNTETIFNLRYGI